jgi:CheY-like chemotaxis protein
MAKTTILIVDREKILVDLLIRSLSTPELTVLGATTAEDAIKLVDLHGPDLVVIDPSIPTGLQLVSSLRSSPNKTKIVAITATEELAARVRSIGIDAVVDRNSGLDALVSAIRNHIDADISSLQQGVRVLVTDDEEGLRNVLSEFLRGQGYSVVFATNGLEAVERVESDPTIQIVLMDVNMPRMGGMEALGRIMSRDPHPNVIMMTAVADRDIARQAMKTGAFDYVLKPFDFPAIEASITACMSHSEYQKQPWWKRLTRR